MLVLGGSMLAGIGCTPGSWTCAYPSRLAKMWPTLEGQHAPKLRVISRARGGTTTASTLPFLEYLLALDESGSAPDLILVDFSVNDACESQDWTVDIGKEAAAATKCRGGLSYTNAVYTMSQPKRAHRSSTTPPCARAMISSASCATRRRDRVKGRSRRRSTHGYACGSPTRWCTIDTRTPRGTSRCSPCGITAGRTARWNLRRDFPSPLCSPSSAHPQDSAAALIQLQIHCQAMQA